MIGRENPVPLPSRSVAHAALSAALLLSVDTGSLATTASRPPRCCLRTKAARPRPAAIRAPTRRQVVGPPCTRDVLLARTRTLRDIVRLARVRLLPMCRGGARRTRSVCANTLALSAAFHATRQQDDGRAGHTAGCCFRLKPASCSCLKGAARVRIAHRAPLPVVVRRERGLGTRRAGYLL